MVLNLGLNLTTAIYGASLCFISYLNHFKSYLILYFLQNENKGQLLTESTRNRSLITSLKIKVLSPESLTVMFEMNIS